MSCVLLLPPDVLTDIKSLASARYPKETCGLLLGREDGNECTVLIQHPARPLFREITSQHVEIDPRDYLIAEAVASASGVFVVGVWHSHLDHSAAPDNTDLDMAWPGWSYLILAVNAGKVVELRSWRMEIDGFCEEEVRHGRAAN